MLRFERYKKKIIIFTIILLCLFSAMFFLKQKRINFAIAGSSDNVLGYAWNNIMGWISFNCINSDSCASVDYGVNISSETSDVSGYAWNSNMGWIDFSPVGPYPGLPNSAAYYNSDTRELKGWAKIVSLADDGWINMGNYGSGTTTGFPKNFPVFFDYGFIDYGVKLASDSGDFSGWAWHGGPQQTGWISFNCLNNDQCAVSDYKVYQKNTLPSASNLSAPNWGNGSACSLSAKQAILRWDFIDPDPGAAQKAYQIIINTTNSTTSPAIDSGKIESINNQFATSTPLLYGQAYYWWVKVWDNYNAESEWIQYDSPSDTDNNDGNNLTFTTYAREFPNIDASWSPRAPSKYQSVTFSDASKYYANLSPFTPNSCDENNCTWQWTFPSGTNITEGTIASSTLVVEFTEVADLSVGLKVTDNEGYYCEAVLGVSTKASLPDWEEVRSR